MSQKDVDEANRLAAQQLREKGNVQKLDDDMLRDLGLRGAGVLPTPTPNPKRKFIKD